MADPVRERLLASYGDLGEVMVAQNLLEAGGVPVRVGDLGGIPSHLLGSLGGVNRSVGLWVLETDVERAVALLKEMESVGSAVDEEALAAEALAAGAIAATPSNAPATSDAPTSQEPFASRSRRGAEARSAPGISRVALVVVVSAVAIVLAQRGCA